MLQKRKANGSLKDFYERIRLPRLQNVIELDEHVGTDYSDDMISWVVIKNAVSVFVTVLCPFGRDAGETVMFNIKSGMKTSLKTTPIYYLFGVKFKYSEHVPN